MRQEMMGFWDAVASAGPYANNLHPAPDRQPHQHLITQFFTGQMLSMMPNSVSALKAEYLLLQTNTKRVKLIIN